MTCEEYQALLTSCLEEGFTPEKEEALRLHEAECPDCAALRRELDALPDSLASLGEDVPPMPADLHRRWTQALKGEFAVMENKEKKTRGTAKTVLAVAAALVLLIGGTIAARDSLPGRRSAARSTTVQTDDGPAYQGAGYSSYASSPYETPMAMEEAYAADYDMEDSLVAYGESSAKGSAPAAGAGMDNGAARRETKLIRNVSLTIATQTFDDSLENLKRLPEGGWISSSSVSTSSSGLRTASLTLRLPADAVDAFLAGAGGYGRVTRQEETTQDVTDSYYDTQSRLESQRALLSRYQELVAQAEDMSDLLTLESAMADIQWQIDSYTAYLNSTDSKVRYSTVSVTLREEKEQERLQVTELSFGERLGAAVSVGWEALTDFLEDMAVFLIAILPLLILVAVIVALAVMIVRRRRKNKEK